MIRVTFLVLLIFVLFSASAYAGSDEILNTYPGDGAEYVPLANKIKVFFDGEMDKSDYSFTIIPSLEGSISSYENAIIFTPGSSLKKSTEYKVTIKNKKNDSSYSWSFTTNSTSLPPAKEPYGEKLASIAIGDSFYTVLDLLGEPDKKTEPIYYEFVHMTTQEYIYTSLGIKVSILIDSNGKTYNTVNYISITSPCKKSTLRGVKIGDPESKVKANYILNYARKNSPIKNGDSLANKDVYCGDIYFGIMFRFDENGKVKEIAIGSFAE